jgi:Bromodomain/Bromodomain extra-terminal - transcription regulation
LKEDQPLLKRLSRPPKDRLRPTEYSYNSHKYSKPISELVKKCTKVLTLVQKHEYSVPFLKPVDYLALNIPDYPLIVKEPMDLSRIEKKLRTGLYSNPMQFAADMRKIWSNAILYNPKSSPIYVMTVAIAEYFESIYKEVEENPFPDQSNEYLDKKVSKLEKKMDEIVNFVPGESNKIDAVPYLEKPMNNNEKRALSLGIKSLAPESLVGVREIIVEECPTLASAGTIEFDLAVLDTSVLRKLERFVKSKQNKAKMDRKVAHRKEMKLKAAKDRIEEEKVVPF